MPSPLEVFYAWQREVAELDGSQLDNLPTLVPVLVGLMTAFKQPVQLEQSPKRRKVSGSGDLPRWDPSSREVW